MLARNDDVDKLRAIGYVGGGAPNPITPPAGQADQPAAAPGAPAPGGAPGAPAAGPPPGPPGFNPDWTHTNAIAFNTELDQIVLSIHSFSEVWIIDHSTTTAEAAAHAGGKRGRGGDLLYRW